MHTHIISVIYLKNNSESSNVNGLPNLVTYFSGKKKLDGNLYHSFPTHKLTGYSGGRGCNCSSEAKRPNSMYVSIGAR